MEITVYIECSQAAEMISQLTNIPIDKLVDILADMRRYNVGIFKQLESEANYALNSHLMNLVYQTYGKALMARELGTISREQFNQLNNLLVVNGLNNPKAKLE